MLSATGPFKTDDEQGEIAATQSQSASSAEELLYFPGPERADHDQLDGRGMLSEIVDERAFQNNCVDFDLGVVVHATLHVRVTGYGTPILLNVTGARLCSCQHPQWSASVPGLVDRQIQNVDDPSGDSSTSATIQPSPIAPVSWRSAADDCYRTMARFRQFLCSRT